MRVDVATGQLEASVTLKYADDLFLMANGELLVGSRTLAPRIYTQGLDEIGRLGTDSRAFVRHFDPIPEINIRTAAGGILVRWPVGVADCVLELFSVLSASAAWQVVTNELTVVDGEYSVPGSTIDGIRMNRLTK